MDLCERPIKVTPCGEVHGQFQRKEKQKRDATLTFHHDKHGKGRQRILRVADPNDMLPRGKIWDHTAFKKGDRKIFHTCTLLVRVTEPPKTNHTMNISCSFLDEHEKHVVTRTIDKDRGPR